MTPEARTLIKAFIDNKALSEAVLGVLTQHVTPEGLGTFVTLLPRDFPNDDYGERVKVRAEAAALLSGGFAQLRTIANDKQGVQSTQNEAR